MSTELQATAFQTPATDIGAAPTAVPTMMHVPANPPPFQPITAAQCAVSPVVADISALSAAKQSHLANGSGDNGLAQNGQSTQNGNVSHYNGFSMM